MQTFFFWIVWGIVSLWALKTFYYSFSKEKLDRLRKTALGINSAVFILSLLPWLPPELGGISGFTLVLLGNILSVVFIILLLISTAIFFTKDPSLLKIAAIGTIVNTFILFILMYQLRPGTFVLTWYDIAPIVSILFLLVGDVVVLLLWQQLQLEERKRKKI